jgi:hypothetical protein
MSAAALIGVAALGLSSHGFGSIGTNYPHMAAEENGKRNNC